ncbi:Peroxin domain-containing protein [Pleurotus pulmonarius]
MATLEYVSIPPCATRLRSSDKKSLDPEPELKTNLPAEHGSEPLPLLSSPTATTSPTSPTTYAVLPQILLSTALLSSGNGVSLPPALPSTSKLMSKKDPLSIPITTVNFRRFVARVGAVFWLQDRVEEIVMWRKGWKYTATWMAAYAFLCIYPRLILLLPHSIVIGVMLVNSPSSPSPTRKQRSHSSLLTPPPPKPPQTEPTPPFTTPVAEGSKEWLANIQGIQNLMGFGADVHDALVPILSHLTLLPTPQLPTSTRARAPTISFYIFVVAVLTLPLLAFVVTTHYIPLRLISLVAGIAPVLLLHPSVLPYVPLVTRGLVDFIVWCVDAFEASSRTALRYIRLAPYLRSIGLYFPDHSSDSPRIGHTIRYIRTYITRFIDNDRLQDDVWNAPITEVELFENERWKADEGSYAYSDDGLTGGSSGQRWSKANLRDTERRGWTRGRDGWNGGVGEEGFVSSNLTFSLASGWAFVETEDWRKDVVGEWVGGLVDDDGWTYTNDVWSEPKANPVYQPPPAAISPSKDAQGQRQNEVTLTATRRRRWTRRIWYRGV